MKHLTVSHRSTYRYAEEVSFGPHRMMLRPRDSHEIRLISASITTSLPAELIWSYDVFGNVICTAHFSGRSNELTIESFLDIERFASAVPTLFDRGTQQPYPPAYSDEERLDLGSRLIPRPDGLSLELEAWAVEVPQRHPGGAIAMLTGLCEEIRTSFAYQTRFAEATQHPDETFALRSGACRDFAALFIAVVRRLGFGARFVSGYLFDPPQDPTSLRGVGATHAWAEVYLPNIGWIEFDPTNALFESDRLIQVAVVSEPHQAQPIAGSFVGSPGAYVGLWVGVDVDYAPEEEPELFADEPLANQAEEV